MGKVLLSADRHLARSDFRSSHAPETPDAYYVYAKCILALSRTQYFPRRCITLLLTIFWLNGVSHSRRLTKFIVQCYDAFVNTLVYVLNSVRYFFIKIKHLHRVFWFKDMKGRVTKK
jgi:hypothetical protein